MSALTPELKKHVEMALREPPLQPRWIESKWCEIWKQGDIAAAVPLLEQSLSDAPEDLTPKLWWIRAQLLTSGMPLSALAASLSGSGSQTELDSNLSRAMLVTSLALAARLAEKNQARLALSILHDSSKLAAADPTFSAALRHELAEYILSLVKAELAKNEAKRQSADYVEELRKKELDLRKHIAELPSPSAPRANKPQRFDAKSILEEANAQDVLKLQPQPSTEWSLGKETDREKAMSASTGEDIQSSQRYQRRDVVRIALGLGLALFLFWGAWSIVFSHPSTAGELRLAMHTSIAMTPEPVLASLPILRRDALSTKIAALNTNLEQVGERVRNLSSSGTPAPTDSNTETSSAVAKTNDQVDQEALQSKAGEKLKNPAEAPTAVALEPLDTSPKAQLPEPNPKDSPYLDPNRLARIPIDELGAPRAPVDHPSLRELRVGPDGRVYGPPANTSKPGIDTVGRGLDGRPVQSYAVEEFPQPVNYRTIVPVQVLSAPSERAIPISRLERDATVQVVSRMGPWLELRSSGGRTGYIYSQDAVAGD